MRLVRDVDAGLEHAPAGRGAAAVGVRTVDRGGVHERFSREQFEQPDHALRQEQGHQDEEQRPGSTASIRGKATVKQLFAPLTSSAPRIAPTSVPRPPTATQIAISIEFAVDISLGLMMPTCGTYSAPAMPQITADSVQMSELVVHRVVAAEHHARFGVADRRQHAAQLAR